MMVLVDTSVWIRALRGQAPYIDELDRLLAPDSVTGHDLVYGELLIGDLGGRANFLRKYESFHRAGTVSHSFVVEFARGRQLNDHGAGWIDIHLLASAIVERLLLWTADSDLDALARELDISYKTRRRGL